MVIIEQLKRDTRTAAGRWGASFSCECGGDLVQIIRVVTGNEYDIHLDVIFVNNSAHPINIYMIIK